MAATSAASNALGIDPADNAVRPAGPCEYPSPAEERITISRATYEDLQANEQFLQKCLSAAIPSEKDRLELMRRARSASASASVSAHEDCPPAQTGSSSGSGSATPLKNFTASDSEEVLDGGRLLADPDGHRRYLGNSAGAAFLDQLREFASTVLPLVSQGDGCLGLSQMEDSFAVLLGRYQTHDSRPLFLPQVDPYYLPSFTEAETLLSTLPSFDDQTNDVSIHYWGNIIPYSAPSLLAAVARRALYAVKPPCHFECGPGRGKQIGDCTVSGFRAQSELLCARETSVPEPPGNSDSSAYPVSFPDGVLSAGRKSTRRSLLLHPTRGAHRNHVRIPSKLDDGRKGEAPVLDGLCPRQIRELSSGTAEHDIRR
ncbi:hypothetical protein VTN96DRAFT_916 [Rasamsonia emersonii]